ncbi:sialidase family protein [Paenibacillus allorhizosphaerae]|uniref:Exo-alpha-sialidase n=1 Tax=Paenibacillus allorhizosphaerae TaxID=2849866 RepID=A0ABN7U0A4_9BACL|nr:sialidase family protein [Paenibacillus allorhizosphaerae]CAG7658989.1 hypothetical protein PAECIP111802_07245 [Paenibacillus allorhizosphaerae]
MKFKLLSATESRKKIGALIVCGALVVTAIGVVSASAANIEASQGTKEGVEVISTNGALDEFGVMTKIENGVKLYSLDGGKTWSKQVPQGFSEKDGKATQSNGTPPREGEVGGSLTKVEDGVQSYSTDNGKTWNNEVSQGTKEGVEVISTNGALDELGVMTKIENGVKLYSLDDGKTWSKQAPQGFSEKDGKATQSNGTPPREGEVGGSLTKVEDGVQSYSTDGGKTWNKK